MRRNFLFDTLNKVLLGVALACLFLLPSTYTLMLAGACFVLVLMRAFSRDYQARQRENDIFKNFFARQKAKANSKKGTKVRRIRPVYEGRAGESTMHANADTPKSDSTHRVYKCPKCKQSLRVPKGKGKILITCQNCGHKFQKKT